MSQIGCTTNSTLQDIVNSLPGNLSKISLWLSQEVPVLYNEVLNGTGFSHAFGILDVERSGKVWTVTFNAYNSNDTFLKRYTTINNVPMWSEWTKTS